jgi:hypothetical protein
LQYDNLGYIIGSDHYNLKDSLLRKQVLTHDGKGNYTKNEYFDSNGKKLYYQFLSLNDKGKVINMMAYDGKDSLLSKSINTYNEKGLLVKQNTGNSVWDYKYLKFDKNGNWLELAAIIDNGKFRVFAERYYEYY